MTRATRATQCLLALVLAGTLLGFSACEQKPAPDPQAGQAETGHGTPAEPAAEEPVPEEAEEFPDTAGSLPATPVEIPLPDRQVLAGTLYDPSQVAAEGGEDEASAEAEEETGPVTRYPLVVLLHMLNGSSRDWGDLPARLVRQGYAVFAYDIRGHGKSTRVGKKGRASWRNFTPADWQKLPGDAEAVVRFLGNTEEYPQLDTSRLALIGGSIGANTAVLVAKQQPSRVKAIVLLSPGLDYKGLVPTTAMVQYPHATFMAVSRNDPYAFDSTNLLYKLAVGPKSLRQFKDVGHGTDMLSHYPALKQDILAWLAQVFAPTPLVVAPASEEPTGEEAEAAETTEP